MKNNPHFALSTVDVKDVNGNEIIDYNKQDFRVFWEKSVSKRILNNVENTLIKKTFTRDHGWFIDIGCGFARNLPSYYSPGKQIVLVDYAINHLEMAQENYKNYKNIFYVAADANHLPFKDDVFTHGICIRLLHHINKPGQFLNNMVKIFAKNSQCLLTYLNKRNIFRIPKYGTSSFTKDHEKLSNAIYGTHPHYFKKLTDNAGFKVKRTRGTGFIHQITHASSAMNKFLDSHPGLEKILTPIEIMANAILGRMKLSLMQFMLLQKRTGDTPSGPVDLDLIVKCPSCSHDVLFHKEDAYVCEQCGREYPIKNNIIDFRIDKINI